MSSVYTYGTMTDIGFSNDGDEQNATYVKGDIGDDAEITPDEIVKGITTGSLFGGHTLNCVIPVMDEQDYNDLRTKMLSQEKFYWHFKFEDGNTYVSNVPTNVKVRKVFLPDAEGGVQGMILTLFFKSHLPVLE